jgi:hypothetical protein
MGRTFNSLIHIAASDKSKSTQAALVREREAEREQACRELASYSGCRTILWGCDGEGKEESHTDRETARSGTERQRQQGRGSQRDSETKAS